MMTDFKVVYNSEKFARVTTSDWDFGIKFKDGKLHGRSVGYFYSTPEDTFSSTSFMIEFKHGNMVLFKLYEGSNCIMKTRYSEDGGDDSKKEKDNNNKPYYENATSMSIYPNNNLDPLCMLYRLYQTPYEYYDVILGIVKKLH